MNTLRRVGRDTGELTDEEMQYIDTRVVETVRPLLVARRLFPVFNLNNAGIFKVKGYRESDMSPASISKYGKSQNRDRIELEDFSVDVDVISKDYKLNWRDVISSRNGGIPLETRSAENAGRQVAEEEDRLLISGEDDAISWPADGIEGLASATGRNQEISAGAWPAFALTDVNDAIDELETDGHYGPYGLICRSPQMAALRTVVGVTNAFYFELIQKLCTRGIFVSNNLYAGVDGDTDSALVVELGADNFDMIIGRDLTTYSTQDEDMNILGKVYEVVTPHIKRPASICEITAIP